MPAARVLLVDDHAEVRRAYAEVLERDGYAVVTAGSGAEALKAAARQRPDLVLSDVNMPRKDGLALLERLRAEAATTGVPVILMSGVRVDPEDQASGLRSGADDYLTKPVTPALLKAKVAAVLRRYRSNEELGEVLKSADLVLDVGARVVKVSDERVALTRKEFDLLTALLRRPGKVQSIESLLETVWGYDPEVYDDPHTVSVHVSTLRRKIGPRLAARIAAVPGVGYRFD
jgi:DNA-binding response OmpR family regulator